MRFFDFLFKKPPPLETWIVWINRKQEMKFKNNSVKTSKYTVYNFLFKCVLLHLIHPISLYFLMIAILQSTPNISSTHGVPTVLLPLFIVVSLDALIDGYHDWQRHISDRAENNRKVFCIAENFNPPQKSSEILDSDLGLGNRKSIRLETLELLNLECKLSSQIHVGDLIFLKNRDEIPADVVLLTSSDVNGTAYVETLCLDGETDLKPKHCLQVTHNFLTNNIKIAIEQINGIEGYISSTFPDVDLRTFTGVLNITNIPKESQPETTEHTIDINNVLLRGCTLRNTVWALGVVIYTGHDTKIYMNMSPPSNKYSNLDTFVKRVILFIFCIQILCSICASLVNYYFYIYKEDSTYPYISHIYKDMTGFNTIFISFFTWISITANLIPISALLTINLVRLIQGYFIYVDKHMYSKELNLHTTPRNTNVNELLGQIQICFSDKTGTLTRNMMNFRKFSIEGVSYGKGLTDIRRSYLIKNGYTIPESSTGKFTIINNYVNLVDDHIMDDLHNPSSPRHIPLIEMCLHFTLNNGIFTETDDNNNCIYSSASSDESTFAYASRSFGIDLKEKNTIYSILNILGREIKVKILVNVEFNNYRKRSSVICAIPKNNIDLDHKKPIAELVKDCRLILFTKGADSVILKLIDKRPSDDYTINYIKEYENDGLRVICFAKKELDVNDFLEWYKRYQVAENSIKNRYENCIKLIEELECNMKFQGVTGVEDKLQDSIPESIEYMTKANIRTWMLTGDNLDAAINIGLATNFIYTNSERVDLTFKRINSEVESSGEDRIKVYDRLLDDYITNLSAPKYDEDHKCLLIDGDSVSFIFNNMINDTRFTRLCMLTDTAICARMTPSNKGDIVSIFAKQHKMVTLAIGDGANDCNMIQKADVGIGIKGNEGAQAFNVSDYGISEFKFIVPLLLFHGRLTYRRMSKLLMYTFYKNIVLVIPVFIYGFYSLFSGQLIYNDIMVQFYNIFFTSIPAIIFGSTEQDVDRRITLKYPQLYKLGHVNFYMNMWVFILWVLNGIFQSIVITGIAYFAFGTYTSISSNGEPYSIWFVGYCILTVIFVVSTLKLLMETYYLNFLTFIGISLSVYAYVYVSSSFNFSPKVGATMRCIMSMTSKDLRFWIFLFVSTMASIYRDYVWKVYLHSFKSRIYHYIQNTEY